MQSEQRGEYSSTYNQYLTALNRINLLLVKEHTFKVQREEYQKELEMINNMIIETQSKSSEAQNLPIQKEFYYLQQIIKGNKKEISNLSHKLQTKETLMKQLNGLLSLQEKYLKLISTEYQSSIQQKLSMIKGKVDDLKKKVKQINKDILAYEQQHKQMMDEYSCKEKSLQQYRNKNQNLRKEIESMKNSKKLTY